MERNETDDYRTPTRPELAGFTDRQVRQVTATGEYRREFQPLKLKRLAASEYKNND
jgi:hypothetical protein